MGWELRTIEVVGRLDSHGGDRQRFDASAWEELRDRIAAIAREHRYAELDVTVIGGDDL